MENVRGFLSPRIGRDFVNQSLKKNWKFLPPEYISNDQYQFGREISLLHQLQEERKKQIRNVLHITTD